MDRVEVGWLGEGRLRGKLGGRENVERKDEMVVERGREVGIGVVVEMTVDSAGTVDSVETDFELVGRSGFAETIDFGFVVGTVDSGFDW